MTRLKQVLIVFIFLLLLCNFGRAAFEEKGCGIVFIASGYSGIASENPSFAVFINPAKLVFIPESRIEIFYRNFYQLADLNQISLSAVTRVRDVPLAFGFNRFGNKLYAENEIRLAGAWEIWEPFTIAVSGNLYQLHIERYGDAVTFGLTMSFLYRINSYFSTAFVITNLNEPHIGKAQEPIPFYGSVGLTYRFAEGLTANLDLFQEENQEFDYRFGMSYHLQSWFSIMGGFRDITNSFTAGFNVNYASLRIGYAFEYHPTLGANHSISTSYEF